MKQLNTTSLLFPFLLRIAVTILLLSIATLTRADVTCRAGIFVEGGEASVQCNFGLNVKAGHHDFNIMQYSSQTGDNGNHVLLCNWAGNTSECTAKDGYSFNKSAISDTVELKIHTVSHSMEGMYVCQLVPDPGLPVGTCNLNVTEPPPPTTTPCPTCTEDGSGGSGAGFTFLGIFLVVIPGCVGLFYLWWKYDIVKRRSNGRADNNDDKDADDGWSNVKCCWLFLKVTKLLHIRRPPGKTSEEEGLLGYTDDDINDVLGRGTLPRDTAITVSDGQYSATISGVEEEQNPASETASGNISANENKPVIQTSPLESVPPPPHKNEDSQDNFDEENVSNSPSNNGDRTSTPPTQNLTELQNGAPYTNSNKNPKSEHNAKNTDGDITVSYKTSEQLNDPSQGSDNVGNNQLQEREVNCADVPLPDTDQEHDGL